MKVEPGHQKRRVLEELLAEGMVLIALDARADGVMVPEHLAHDPQLRLNLSYRFGLPMEVGIEGVTATLTFGGVPHGCVFPWRAIFLMVCHGGGQPHLFPDDIPAELGYEPQGELDGVMQESPDAAHAKVLSEAPRPTLSLVRGEPTKTPPAAKIASPGARSPATRQKSPSSGPRALRAQPAASPQGSAPDKLKDSKQTDASVEGRKPKADAPTASTDRTQPNPPPSEPPPGAPRSRSHLRVVK